MRFKKAICKGVINAIVLMAVAGGGTLFAQQAAIQSKSINLQPFGATDVISPNGLLLAHFEGEPDRLYVKVLSSGEDKVILKSVKVHSDWDVVGGLSFSPDGGRLMFKAGPARAFTGKIYSIRTDGSDLKVLASDIQAGQRELADTAVRARYDVDFSDPLYSPDGKKVAVRVDVAVTDDDDENAIKESGGADKTYVGLLSAEGEQQSSERIAEGNLLFWSADGKRIYYLGNGRYFYEVEVTTKQSRLIADAHDVVVLGRVPGTDAIFVVHTDDKVPSVMTFDGLTASQAKNFAAGISLTDSEGRILSSIKEFGPHQLSLSYESRLPSKNAGISRLHTEIVGFY